VTRSACDADAKSLGGVHAEKNAKGGGVRTDDGVEIAREKRFLD